MTLLACHDFVLIRCRASWSILVLANFQHVLDQLPSRFPLARESCLGGDGSEDADPMPLSLTATQASRPRP